MAPRKPVRDLPVVLFTDWDTVGRVKSALASMEQGYFAAAASIAESMGRDDRIVGVMATRVNALRGLPLVHEPAGDGRRGASVAKALEKDWKKLFPKAQTSALLRWGIYLGVGLGELVWYDKDGKYRPTPRLKVWHPQFVTYRWDTRTYWVTTADGLIEVTPGDGHWILYTPFGEERGWVHGLVRSLSIPWLVRQWAIRDWARNSEIHGQPIKKAIIPEAGTDEDKDRFVEEVAGLGSESTIRLVQGSDTKFDVQLLEAMGQSWEGFESLADKMESSIAITVLGQNLTTEVKSGSLAASKTHDRIRQDVLESDAESLMECLREQGVMPWAAANYGDPELAPESAWQTDPPEDLGTKATALNTMGSALNQFKKLAGKLVDNVAVLEAAGVPLLPEGQREELEEPEPGDEDPKDPKDDDADPEARAAA
jgi:hypothetical protein